jgi:hypothetical protein
MLEEENINPDAEQGEQEEAGTLPDNESEEEEESDNKGDPLDAISDVEALRSEAKKYRGIATRKGKSPVPHQESTETPYLTKKDFYLSNEKKAINEVKAQDKDIEANFDAIKSFYVPRRGKDTPEDIREDLKDAFILWKARQAPTANDPSALATMTVTRPSGQAPASTASTDSDPRFQTAARPENWYSKK